jgi:hypothetical protein
MTRTPNPASPGLAARLVQIGCATARLPLTVAEVLGARSGVTIEDQPLVVAYDSTEAQFKKLVGVLIHDEGLVQRAEAEARALRRRVAANWLAGEADAIRRSTGARIVPGPEASPCGGPVAPVEERRAELEMEEEEARRKVAEKAEKRAQAAARVARARHRAAEAKAARPET